MKQRTIKSPNINNESRWNFVEVSPLLINHYGTVSKAAFVSIIEETIQYEMRKFKKGNVMIENLNIVYI